MTDESGARLQSQPLRPAPHHHHDLEDQLHHEDDTNFPALSAPARRALSAAGHTHLDQLALVCERDLKKLHGMGPTAIAALGGALAERGLTFRT
ncbi:MAG TPA: hypothetical protein VG325_07035 [Solirubrobacteraceae bacterium]|nr:hypothetical protein [Solirubrobacteraceae bacterium]